MSRTTRMRAFAGLSFSDFEVGAFVFRLLSKYFISISELQLHHNFFFIYRENCLNIEPFERLCTFSITRS